MICETVLVGKVTGVIESENKKSDLLLVETTQQPEFPKTVACEFYGEKNRAMLEGIGDGDMVRVYGSPESRESNGRWWTKFGAYKVTKLNATAAPKARGRAAPHRGDDIPF